MNPTEQTTPDIDRATALRALVAMTETLPAPQGIRFAKQYPDQLYIELDSVNGVTAWATALDVNDWAARGDRHGSTIQWRVYGRWHGYYLTVEAILNDPKPAGSCDCTRAGA